MAESSDQIKAIGGYFELADRTPHPCAFPHSNAVLLNTARNALEYVMLSAGEVRKVYVPYYTCEVVFHSLKKLGIGYECYHTNERLEIADDIELGEGEYIVVNNYFGIKDAYCSQMADRYGNRIIIDNAQALFARLIPGAMQIYSMRKFAGVSDGGAAYTGGLPGFDVIQLKQDDSACRADYLRIRREQGPEAGFAAYRRSEQTLDMQPILRMSAMTEDILLHTDFARMAEQRRTNFALLHKHLGGINKIAIPDLMECGAPLAYPLLTDDAPALRQKLLEERVYVARYWPNVVEMPGFEREAYLAEHIVPLPIDQRYGEQDMKRIIELIQH